MWHEITYPFPTHNGFTDEVWAYDFLPVLGFNLKFTNQSFRFSSVSKVGKDNNCDPLTLTSWPSWTTMVGPGTVPFIANTGRRSPSPMITVSASVDEKRDFRKLSAFVKTHWVRVTYICVVHLTIIGSDNGLAPGRRQAIIGTNAGILLIGSFNRDKRQWNFNQNSCIFIQENALEKVVCKRMAILPRPQCFKSHSQNRQFCLELNVLKHDHIVFSLQWRHNALDGVSNHQRLDCLLTRLFRRRSNKTSKLRFTGLCEGNSPVTGEFPTQRATDAENGSIWWHHHDDCVSESLTFLGQFTLLSTHTVAYPSNCVEPVLSGFHGHPLGIRWGVIRERHRILQSHADGELAYLGGTGARSIIEWNCRFGSTDQQQGNQDEMSDDRLGLKYHGDNLVRNSENQIWQIEAELLVGYVQFILENQIWQIEAVLDS